MKNEDWMPRNEDDDFASSLHQRTDELYRIPNSQPNDDGLIECPVLALRDLVVFPRMISPIFIPPGPSLLAIQEAQYNEMTVIGLPQKNAEIEVPDPEDLLPIGVEIAVGRLLNMPDGNNSALIQGRRRVEVVEVIQREPYIVVKAKPLVEETDLNHRVEALMRATRSLFEKCVQLDHSLPEEAQLFSINITEPGWLADMVATAISFPIKQRQALLLLRDPIERLKKVNALLAQELDVLRLEDEIQEKVQTEVDRSQREFYLREQMKAIQTELGEGDIWSRELTELRLKLDKKNLPDEVYTQARKEVERLGQMQSLSPEVGIIRTYLEWILDLPWFESTVDNLDVRHAKRVLEQHHFGLRRAKERILEYIAVISLNPEKHKQPILCFVGPPGTGKTSLGKSIAQALGRKFVRVSLGGVRDEAEIRGHRRTYIGALPGRVLQTMKRAETVNPLFMLDEIDKLGADFRGDPSAALLEVLDPEQNHAFSDHYLEVPYDLSHVLFITTANSLNSIPPALIDRMEVIEFPGYLEEEKVEIARRFLIPRQVEESGLKPEDVQFEDDALRKIIEEYTYEAGVRNLEREIGKVCRKIARKKSEKKSFQSEIGKEVIEKHLGPPQYFISTAERQDETGVATAVAWTESGGEIMPVEVLIVDGKGNLQITGQIGEIMQESAQAALSYIKSRAKYFHIAPDVFEKSDIHIHVPEGAIPKDGPSAGVTMATAMVSALTGRKVYKDIGMTGEITLRGKILPVGGVREKVLAAQRSGLKRLFLPERNIKDLVDVPAKVKIDLKIIPVTHMDDILKRAIYPEKVVKKKRKQ
jgi:ATP-dependent Lon protease